MTNVNRDPFMDSRTRKSDHSFPCWGSFRRFNIKTGTKYSKTVCYPQILPTHRKYIFNHYAKATMHMVTFVLGPLNKLEFLRSISIYLNIEGWPDRKNHLNWQRHHHFRNGWTSFIRRGFCGGVISEAMRNLIKRRQTRRSIHREKGLIYYYLCWAPATHLYCNLWGESFCDII